MKPHNTVTESLTALHEAMMNETLEWPKMFSDSYRFNRSAQELLTKRANTDAPKHGLWNEAYMHVSMIDSFDALFWIMSFEYLANKFSVPMSWVAALRLYAHPDAMGDKWGVKALPSFVDDEGYCQESLWAAHLDGVKAGLITIEDFPFMRRPEAVEFSDLALDMATQKAESLDMDVDDFLASIDDDTLDMTLPTRGDDE